MGGILHSSIHSANKNGFHASQREHLIVLNFAYCRGYKYCIKNYLRKSHPAVSYSSKPGQDECMRIIYLTENTRTVGVV